MVAEHGLELSSISIHARGGASKRRKRHAHTTIDPADVSWGWGKMESQQRPQADALQDQYCAPHWHRESHLAGEESGGSGGGGGGGGSPPTHPILLSGPYFSLSLSRLHCTLPTLGLCNLEDYRKDCLWLDKTARKWVGRREGGKRKTNKEKIKEMNWLAGTDLSSLKLEASLWCWADRKRMAEEPKWLRLDVDDEPLVDVKGSTAPSSERWGLNMLLVVVVPVVVEGMREAAERAAPGPVR